MTPMVTFSRALATTLFSRFAEARWLARKVWLLNVGWLSFCLIGVLVLGGTLMRLCFGPKYAPVIGLLPLTALAALFTGLTVPLNKFLGAHGKGDYVRTIAFLLSISTVVLMFGLISNFGIIGACYASAGSALTNFLLNYHFYRKTVRGLNLAN
jgi:O-antigen/teichoic acid export membrane protein